MPSPIPTPSPLPLPAMHAAAPTPVPMVHLPFLPFHDNPANWDNFAIAFWSGLLYSVIVGLAVGLAIYAIQRQNEKRRLRREAESDILRMKGRCNLWIGFGMRNYRRAWPYDGSLEVMAIVQEESRVRLWQILIPDEKNLYQTIEEFQRTYEGYVGYVTRLTSTIGSVLRRELGDEGDGNEGFAPTLFGIDYDDVEQYCLRRALGEGERTALAHVGVQVSRDATELESLWHRVAIGVQLQSGQAYDGGFLSKQTKELNDAIHALAIALTNVTFRFRVRWYHRLIARAWGYKND